MLVGEGGGEGPRGVSPVDPRLSRAAPQMQEKQEDLERQHRRRRHPEALVLRDDHVYQIR